MKDSMERKISMKDEDNSSSLSDKNKSDILTFINTLNTQIGKIQSQLVSLNGTLAYQSTFNDKTTRRLENLEDTTCDLQNIDSTDTRIKSIVLATDELNTALSTQTDLIEQLYNENTKLQERMNTIQGYRTIKLT